MPLTKYPHGVSSYGVPLVGEGRNMWGSTWFVDGTNGSDANGGKDPSSAFATVAKAISSASAQDTIYVRQLAPAADATDPLNYSENLTIAYSQYGLRLVGAGSNPVNPFYTQIKGTTTGPVLTINAPSVSVENLCFNRGSSTTGIIRLEGDNSASSTAWGTLIANCHIRNSNSQANAGIYSYSGSYNTIYGCTFVACNTGIYATSGATYPMRALRVQDCIFLSSNGSAVGGNHIITAGVQYEQVVTGCHFDKKPTSEFVEMVGHGILSDSYFASADITASSGGSAINVASTVFVSGCYDNSGALIAT